MASLNFDVAPGYPQVDLWGDSAEQVLRHHPDLTLIRCRQLLELWVRALEHRSGTRWAGTLSERINSLSRAGELPRSLKKRLHTVRMEANEAVHVRSLHPVGIREWDKPARKALGLELDKAEQTSDWTRRPLTKRQAAYAAMDVEVLMPLFGVFRAQTSGTSGTP